MDAAAPASIHWCDYPRVDGAWIDAALERRMATVRALATLGRRVREDHKIKVRQPLRELTVVHRDASVRADVLAASALIVTVTLPHDDLAAAPVTVTIAEGRREACRVEIHDHAPVECRLALPEDRWPLVRIAVGRAWRTENGEEHAALVAARFER